MLCFNSDIYSVINGTDLEMPHRAPVFVCCWKAVLYSPDTWCEGVSVNLVVMRWDGRKIDTWTASSCTSRSGSSRFTCTQHMQTHSNTHNEWVCECSSCCAFPWLCNYPLATAPLQKSPVIAAQCRRSVPVSDKSLFFSFISSLSVFEPCHFVFLKVGKQRCMLSAGVSCTLF